MTIKLSTGLRNAMAAGLGLGGVFNRGYMKIFSGSQPSNADAAETGTLLGTVTSSSGSLTKETRATATMTATASTGTLASLLLAGTVPMIEQPTDVVAQSTTTLSAALLCDVLNRTGLVEASYSGAVVTVKPRPGIGDAWNSLVLTASAIFTAGTFTSGVDAANALVWTPPVPAGSGVLAKLSTQVWSFSGAATGTAGWFRLYSSDTADSGGAISGAPYYPRLDGSIGTSGSDLNLANTSITSGAPVTIDQFQFTVPAS